MKFGGEMERKIEDKVEQAIMLLQNHPADFGEKNGRYFAMGIEMNAEEYNSFLARLTSMSEEIKKSKIRELSEDNKGQRAA